MGLINVLLTFDYKSTVMNKQEFDSLVIKQSSSLRTYAYHFTHDADDAGLHVVSVYPLLSKENMFVANVPPGLAE